MIDIHSHILPGLDDGAKTLEESVAMVKMAAEAGTTDIVASPHSDIQYSFDYDLVTGKVAELQAAVGDSIRIHRGCDFHLHYDNIQDALANPTRYTIANKRYLLVEFSDLMIPRTTTDVFYRMMTAGMIPIVTHPERNPLLQKRLSELEAWAAEGVLMQVTAGALLGRWGKEAKACAGEMMRRNLVHFVASDGHDTSHRPPVLNDAYEYVRNKWGEERARKLFIANPGAALAGEPIDCEPAEAQPVRPWWRFWSKG